MTASDLAIVSLSPATEADMVALVNAYTRGWPYTRPIDAGLLAHWPILGDRYQPANMLIARAGGRPLAFAHGESRGREHFVHLLALAPGAVDAGVALLAEIERRARAAEAKGICGPTCSSGAFYGGYLLGLEPYHPHWAADATDAFVQAGFVMTQSEAFMVADLSADPPQFAPPADYEIADANADPEFKARVFRLVALSQGKEVATCGGRLYPELRAADKPIGQLGFVGADEAHRGKGLATALVSRSLHLLRDWGAGLVLISTGFENAPALRAYEKAGFRRKHNLNEWSKPLV